jgi:hypothetical protein
MQMFYSKTRFEFCFGGLGKVNKAETGARTTWSAQQQQQAGMPDVFFIPFFLPFGYIWRAFKRKMLMYLMVIWYFYDNSVYFVVL